MIETLPPLPVLLTPPYAEMVTGIYERRGVLRRWGKTRLRFRPTRLAALEAIAHDGDDRLTLADRDLAAH